MAKGDQADVTARLLRVLPPWFPNPAPVLNAVLQAPAHVGSFVYGLIQFAHAQLRIQTSTGGWLDLFSYDYFGRSLPRGILSDIQFQAAILQRLNRSAGTRPAVIANLETLTNQVPIVVEPWRPLDTGTYTQGSYSAASYGYGSGYYGSNLLPYQLFVQAYRKKGGGIAGMQGYGASIGLGGYNVGTAYMWATPSFASGLVTDAQIYEEIAESVAAGVVAWASLAGAPPPGVPGPLVSLAIVGETPTTVSLSWTAPVASPPSGGPPEMYWVLAANPGSPPAYMVATVFVPGTTVTVTGLTVGVGYNFYVAAVNSVGSGPFSEVSGSSPIIEREDLSILEREDGSSFYME